MVICNMENHMWIHGLASDLYEAKLFLPYCNLRSFKFIRKVVKSCMFHIVLEISICVLYAMIYICVLYAMTYMHVPRILFELTLKHLLFQYIQCGINNISINQYSHSLKQISVRQRNYFKDLQLTACTCLVSCCLHAQYS